MPLLSKCNLRRYTAGGIDGEPVVVSVSDGRVISPGDAIKVRGRGMPNQKTGERGDVLVVFEKITFPAKVSEAQRKALKAAFKM